MASKKFEAVSIAAKKYDSSRYDDVTSKVLPTEKEIVVKSQRLTDDGHIETKYEMKKVKLSDATKDLRWQDFSIDSLAMCGALGNATFSQLSPDRFGVLDSVDSKLDSVPTQSVNVENQVTDVENNEVN